MKKILTILAAVLLAGVFATAAAQDDTYVYMTFGGIDTLDPEGAYDTASGTALENIYETLYTYDGTAVDQFVPALATDYEVSDDGLTYTYTLREGVQFHSGNMMTCRDVEYSIERILVMNDPSSGVWFQSEALLGTAANANEDDSITWERIDNAVECIDDYTVQFNLPSVDPAFFGKLIYTNASVVDSQWAIENGEWSGTEDDWREWVGVDPREGFLHDNASGTGAYRLVNWDGTDSVYERFDGYWGETPDIATVQYRIVDELATRILALQNGEADRITLGSDSDWATLESQVRGLDGVTVWEDDEWLSLAVGAMHMNQAIDVTDNAVNVGSGQLDGAGIPSDFFADVDVRKGFAYSFDQQVMIDELFLGKGQKLTMALPPSFLGYDPNVPTYEFDPEMAEQHFREAWDGAVWDTGFEMTISYNTGNATRQIISEILKANVEDLNAGFRVNVRGIQWPDFLADRNDNKLPISLVGWLPDYADPDNYMWTFYHSEGYYGSQLNFEDEEIDRLLEDARATTVESERELYYSQVAHRAYELAPTVPYPSALNFIVTNDSIEGVYYNPMISHNYKWKDIVKN